MALPTKEAVPGLAAYCTYDRVLAVFAFLAILLAAALSPMQTDTWWQLRAGADMWASGHVLLTDRYSYTAYGGLWPNHEWLSEVVFFAAYKVGGLPLLSLFAAALVLAAWAIVWRLTPGSARVRLVLVACVLPTASMHWEPRPHAFSLLFVMVTVFLLQDRRVVWLPLVFWIWANCHGGVLLGFVLLIAALAVEMLEGDRSWRRVLVVVVSCGVAVTLTPLGASFWGEMIRSMARIRQYPLGEWQRPEVTDIRQLPYWLSVAGLAAAVVRRWRELRAPGNRSARLLCACTIGVLPFSLTAVRGESTFLMLAVPAIASVWALKGNEHRVDDHLSQRPVLNLALMSGASLVVAVTLAYAYSHQISHLRWAPLPAASTQALQTCPGNLYNRYDEGGYLIWFAPGRRVFLDGRQDPYPASLVLAQIDAERSGEYERLFDRYDIRCAYLPTASPVFPRLVADGWTSLYRDRDWAVVRRAD